MKRGVPSRERMSEKEPAKTTAFMRCPPSRSGSRPDAIVPHRARTSRAPRRPERSCGRGTPRPRLHPAPGSTLHPTTLRARRRRGSPAHEGSWGEESILVQDVDAAEAFLDRMIAPGDVVLVKSSHGAGLWRLGDYLTATGGTACCLLYTSPSPRDRQKSRM